MGARRRVWSGARSEGAVGPPTQRADDERTSSGPKRAWESARGQQRKGGRREEEGGEDALRGGTKGAARHERQGSAEDARQTEPTEKGSSKQNTEDSLRGRQQRGSHVRSLLQQHRTNQQRRSTRLGSKTVAAAGLSDNSPASDTYRVMGARGEHAQEHPPTTRRYGDTLGTARGSNGRKPFASGLGHRSPANKQSDTPRRDRREVKRAAKTAATGGAVRQERPTAGGVHGEGQRALGPLSRRTR